MADTSTDDLERAARALELADAEPLENARQKHIASAKVWEDLAVKAQRLANNRAAREQKEAAAPERQPEG